MTRKRWFPEDKIQIVLESMNTNISVAELCRKHAVLPVMFYVRKQKFIDGGKAAISANFKPDHTTAENERLKRLIGELTITNDALKKRWKEAKDDCRTNHDAQWSQPEGHCSILESPRLHTITPEKIVPYQWILR